MFHEVPCNSKKIVPAADRPLLPSVRKTLKKADFISKKPDREESASLLELAHSYIDLRNSVTELAETADTALYAFKEYGTTDSALHTTESSSLLHISDLMADDPLDRYDIYAAEARLEHVLLNTDERWLDHQESADHLIQLSLEFEQGISDFHRAHMLQICAPIFSVIGQKVSISPEELLDGTQQTRAQLIDYISANYGHLPPQTPDEFGVPDNPRGFANEAALLALLLDPRLINAGLFAIPSFSHQDIVHRSVIRLDNRNDELYSASFDVGIYRCGDSKPFRKIQTKSSPERFNTTEPHHYQNDIRVIYANQIAAEGVGFAQSGQPKPELFKVLADGATRQQIDAMVTGILRRIDLVPLAYPKKVTPLTVAEQKRA